MTPQFSDTLGNCTTICSRILRGCWLREKETWKSDFWL